MTSCPEAMSREFENFEKEELKGLTLGHVDRQWGCLPFRQTVEKLSSGHGVEKLKSDHGVLQITTDRDLKHYGMRSAFVWSDSTVSIVISVSLYSCRRKSRS